MRELDAWGCEDFPDYIDRTHEVYKVLENLDASLQIPDPVRLLSFRDGLDRENGHGPHRQSFRNMFKMKHDMLEVNLAETIFYCN